MDDLIHDIDAFCEAQGISPWQFGLLALNDKPFVKQLREGRRVWPHTEAKVRDFMTSYPARQDRAA